MSETPLKIRVTLAHIPTGERMVGIWADANAESIALVGDIIEGYERIATLKLMLSGNRMVIVQKPILAKSAVFIEVGRSVSGNGNEEGGIETVPLDVAMKEFEKILEEEMRREEEIRREGELKKSRSAR
jgi:hypothetical protein